MPNPTKTSLLSSGSLTDSPRFWLLNVATAGALMFAMTIPGSPLLAQGLDAEGAIDTIVGTQVETGETEASRDAARLEAAIEHAADSAAEIRRRFRMENVEIIYVPDLGSGDTPVDEKMTQQQAAIEELRQSIEGSAIFYHAVNSRGILLRDVVAVEFDGDDARIFTMTKPSAETAPAQ